MLGGLVSDGVSNGPSRVKSGSHLPSLPVNFSMRRAWSQATQFGSPRPLPFLCEEVNASSITHSTFRNPPPSLIGATENHSEGPCPPPWHVISFFLPSLRLLHTTLLWPMGTSVLTQLDGNSPPSCPRIFFTFHPPV